MIAKPLPDSDYLWELFTYDADSGVLYRAKARSNRVKVGDTVGCKNGRGYLETRIDGKIYLVHRIVWKMYNDKDPVLELDHINRSKADNRIINLRDVTRSVNGFNRGLQKNNTSKCSGVDWNKSKSRWQSRIKINQKVINLGHYKKYSDAVKARKSAEQKLLINDIEVAQ